MNGFTLCGTRTYSFTPAFSWLTMTNPPATPDANTFSVESLSPSDVGDHLITVTGWLTLYSNVTSFTTFTVKIADCIITAFNAPTLAVQSY